MPRVFPIVKKVTIVVGGGAVVATKPDQIKISDKVTNLNLVLQDRIKLSDTVNNLSLTLLDRIRLSDSLTATLNATAVKSDNIKLKDNVSLIQLVLQDKIKVTDSSSLVQLILQDKLHPSDKISQVSLTLQDKVKPTDSLANVAFTVIKYGPSGTPNTDPGGDAWVDQANAGVNHGTTTPMNIQKATVNDEQQGWIEVDFTKFTGLSVLAGGTHNFAVLVSNASPVQTPTLTFTFYVFVARPFTESTLTWTNRPALPAAQTTKTFAVPASANLVLAQVTLADADITAFLGKWMLIVLTQTGALPQQITVPTREAVASRQWALAFQLKL